MFSALFLFFLAIGVVQGNVTQLNDEIDLVLDKAREEIMRHGNDILSVADLDGTFTYKFLYKIESDLHCWDGFARNISTARRLGNVVIGKEDRSDLVQLTVPLRLSNYAVLFLGCLQTIRRLVKETDKAEFVFPFNTVQLNITLEGEGTDCVAKIAGMKIYKPHLILMDTENLLMMMTDYWVKEIVKDYFDLKLNPVVISEIENVLSYYLKISNLCNLI